MPPHLSRQHTFAIIASRYLCLQHEIPAFCQAAHPAGPGSCRPRPCSANRDVWVRYPLVPVQICWFHCTEATALTKYLKRSSLTSFEHPLALWCYSAVSKLIQYANKVLVILLRSKREHERIDTHLAIDDSELYVTFYHSCPFGGLKCKPKSLIEPPAENEKTTYVAAVVRDTGGNWKKSPQQISCRPPKGAWF